MFINKFIQIYRIIKNSDEYGYLSELKDGYLSNSEGYFAKVGQKSVQFEKVTIVKIFAKNSISIATTVEWPGFLDAKHIKEAIIKAGKGPNYNYETVYRITMNNAETPSKTKDYDSDMTIIPNGAEYLYNKLKKKCDSKNSLLGNKNSHTNESK